MTEKYPDHETYRALYKRYYDGRDVAELLRLLKPIDGMRVLDLCGGDGRLSLAALVEGASNVELVDASAAMIPPPILADRHIHVRVQKVHDALLGLRMRLDSFDRIVCRQAVNYWLNTITAGLVSRVLKPSGVFVFNTFNQRPLEKPYVSEYELDGYAFTEVSWLVGDTVHHVQVRDGMAPHCTSFKWLSPDRLRTLLEPPFTLL